MKGIESHPRYNEAYHTLYNYAGRVENMTVRFNMTEKHIIAAMIAFAEKQEL